MWKCPTRSLDYTFSYVETLQPNEILSFWKKIQFTPANCAQKSFRLCLVAVKRFSKNTYFPEMLISGKGKCFHVFGCISKNFLENIFWCLEKKKENTNQKTQATSHNPEKKNL